MADVWTEAADEIRRETAEKVAVEDDATTAELGDDAGFWLAVENRVNEKLAAARLP